MINLGHKVDDYTDILKKIAVYYNISIPIGKGLVNYDPEPISDETDVEDFLPDNWTTLQEFSVDYYKGRYLDLNFKIQDYQVYLTSAPWVTILGFNSELSESEVEDLLDNYITSYDIDGPEILLRHQNRMISFKDIINSQVTNIFNDGGLTENQKKINYDLKTIVETKVDELIENYSERF